MLGFDNNAPAQVPSAVDVDGLRRFASAVSAQVAGRFDHAVFCADRATAECARAFVSAFGLRAFRRPLDADELDAFAGFLAEQLASTDPTSAVELVISAMLQSPQFLYKIELGHPDEPASLTAWELATRLSYLLWRSMPDDALLEAAAAGQLSTDAQLLQQAERMMQDARARAAIVSFHRRWLGLDRNTVPQKDPALFAAFSDPGAVRDGLTAAVALAESAWLI